MPFVKAAPKTKSPVKHQAVPKKPRFTEAEKQAVRIALGQWIKIREKRAMRANSSEAFTISLLKSFLEKF